MYIPTDNRTRAEIDLSAVKHNYEVIKSHAKAPVCCTIKADGYGHGSVKLGKLYESLGVTRFAVSSVYEADELREGGIEKPILILGYTPYECAKILADENISQCVYSLDQAKKLSAAAVSMGVDVKIHIKLETGMDRLGFKVNDEELGEAYTACNLPGLIPEGIFTHFAVADDGVDGEEFTKSQFNKFKTGVEYLEGKGVKFALRHCCNTAGIFDYPEFHMDMVRAGIGLYGYPPSGKCATDVGLVPAMNFKSVISHIKEINPGDTVGYGRTFTADRKIKVATVPVGYADGLFRANSNGRFAFCINGKPAPILGRVCMDQTMVDVSDIDCAPGDEVTIFGNKESFTAADMAKAVGTISYELICAVSKRVPRVYKE